MKLLFSLAILGLLFYGSPSWGVKFKQIKYIKERRAKLTEEYNNINNQAMRKKRTAEIKTELNRLGKYRESLFKGQNNKPIDEQRAKLTEEYNNINNQAMRKKRTAEIKTELNRLGKYRESLFKGQNNKPIDEQRAKLTEESLSDQVEAKLKELEKQSIQNSASRSLWGKNYKNKVGNTNRANYGTGVTGIQ